MTDKESTEKQIPDFDDVQLDTIPYGESNSNDTSSELQKTLQEVPTELLVRALNEKIQEEPQKKIPDVLHSVAVSQQYSGPIPPPSMLGQYEAIQPGLVDRIVLMAENEQKHRQNLEYTAVDGEINIDARGQHYALACSLALIFGSIFLVYSGFSVSGTILGGGTLTTLAYIFITGRKERDMDTLDNEEDEE